MFLIKVLVFLVTNVLVFCNFEENYKYLQKSLIDNVAFSTEDYESLLQVQKKSTEYSKLSRRQKKKLKKQIEANDEKKNVLENRLNEKKLVGNLFNYIFSKSHILKGKKKYNLTVNELKALRILTSNLINDKPLLERIFKNKTKLGKILQGYRFINSNNNFEENVKKLKAFRDLDINELNTLYEKLARFENEFFDIYSNDTAKERFKLGDNDLNAYIDFRGGKIQRTKLFNKKFGGLFLNLPFIGMVFLHTLGLLTYISGDGFLRSFLINNLYGLFGTKCVMNFESDPESDDALIRICNVRTTEQISCLIPSLIICGFNLAFIIIECYKIHRYFNPSGFYKKLSEKFYCISSYLNTIKMIFDILKNNEKVYRMFGSDLQYTNELINKTGDFSKEELELLNLFDSFNPTWNYWKEWGKRRARKFCRLLYLFDKYKDLYINSIVEIANIETYLCTINLINDPNYRGKICFPEFVNLKTPMINADKCWNPFLNPNKAVPNDIRLGLEIPDEEVYDDNAKVTSKIKNGYSCGLLYGMNAGGKTTILESITLLPIMAMSFGICFAEKAILTKFKRVFTIIDVSSDISKGYSRYMSEVITYDKLTKEIESLESDNDHIFVVFDELFAGTDNKSAGKLSVAGISSILDNKKVLSFIATHNSAPITIAEKNPHIKNFRMLVDLSNNDVVYKYKLVEGAIEESIAEALIKKLVKQGIISYKTALNLSVSL